ncbi:FAD binding domain-containing protein [Nocardioides zeae]|uniref:FAD binding domain-containing protein n=1 Tax=Nocardioides imazamoxiresistens TaxID=3231893 RepID=A0ABU3PXN9_9ACTN|nr:FAD binding domain-containing protein [Nocardioides zeae]MDT9594013.1 FAD binding domain-containing protein [Nocardioides zeae]
MKTPKFTYHAPRTVAEALDLLAEHDADGKVLAGGQSLIPVMAMRLASPAHLVDINHLTDELGGLHVDAEGAHVGALVRHSRLESDAATARAVPLVGQALRHVAHPTIRNRGTTVGSLAHADPSAEMPTVLTLLGGHVVARSVRGERAIEAADFFVGPMESCLAYDELAVSALFPAPVGRFGTAFDEITRRHGDYALCGAGVVATLDEAEQLTSLKVSLVSISDLPEVIDLTDLVQGTAYDEVDHDVVAQRVRDVVDPAADIHASADFRRHLAFVLTRRLTREAAERALAASPDAADASAPSPRTAGAPS